MVLDSHPVVEIYIMAALYGLHTIGAAICLPLMFIRRNTKFLQPRDPAIMTVAHTFGWVIATSSFITMFFEDNNYISCEYLSTIIGMTPPIWTLPFFLFLPTVVFNAELNKLKIKRQFNRGGKQNWRWGIRELFSVRTKVITIVVACIIQLIALVFVQIFVTPLPGDPCLQRSVLILAASETFYVLMLSFTALKILFVHDPFFLRMEIIANMIVFSPILLVLIIYGISPGVFPENFDIRMIGVLGPFAGFPVNVLFPVLLSFDIPQTWLERWQERNEPEMQRSGSGINLISSSSSPHRGSRLNLAEGLFEEFDEFKAVLDTPALLGPFTEFCIECWSTENVLFYKEVQEFQENFDKPEFNKRERAEKICHEYIEPRSPLEVNLESSVRKKVLHEMHENQITASMFNVAQKAIFELMKKDSYARWCKTKGFQEALKSALKNPDSFGTGTGRQASFVKETIDKVQIEPGDQNNINIRAY